MLCIAARLSLSLELECPIAWQRHHGRESVTRAPSSPAYCWALQVTPGLAPSYRFVLWFSTMGKKPWLSPASLKRIKQLNAEQRPAEDVQQPEDPWEHLKEVEEEEDPTVSPPSEADAEAVAPAAEAVGRAKAARAGGARGRRPVQPIY
eukprot:6916984-Heterocapsa_arctica.AAC.1